MKPLIVLLAFCSLAGCGGGQEERRAATPLNTEPVKVVTLTEPYRYQPPTTSYIPANLPVARAAPKQVELAPATSDEAAFSIEDDRGDKLASFELQPVHGRGYPELKVIVQARAIGETTPPQPVRPHCRESAKCEYRLARNYTVSVSNDAMLQMVARGDGVALVARVMNVNAPTAVDVVFSADNQVIGRRRIVLMSD